MKITFSCTSCSMELEGEAAMVGAQVECPGCKTVLIIPRTEFGPGTTIGGYRIISPLGKGGMGEVWLATQLSLEREVALKVLPPQMGMRSESVQRFLQEVRLLARLTHPNIVPAYEAGEDGGVLFFAMACVRGESLDKKLHRDGALTEQEALRIVEKVARALAYAWSQHQLLHRDIKPSNILIDTDGEPKLVDLGLAKSLDNPSNLTRSSAVMGTPNYMSPEQAEGMSTVDHRADMYSLGLTLYHMLTGQVPFDAATPMETLRKQLTEVLPDPREVNPRISEPCVAMLETMLVKNPGGRHKTWEELIADVQRVQRLQNPSVRVGSPGSSMMMRRTILAGSPLVAAQVGRKPRGKGRTPTRVAAAAVAALLLGAVWWISHRPAAEVAKSSPAPKVASSPSLAAKTTPDPKIAKAQAAFEAAAEFARKHPEEIDASVARLEEAEKECVGTDWADKAAREITRLKSEKAKAVEAAIEGFRKEAERAEKNGSYAITIAHLEKEGGPWAAETASARVKLAARLRERQARVDAARETAAKEEAADRARAAEAERRKTAEAKLAAVIEATAADVLRQELGNARQRLATSLADLAMVDVTNDLARAADSVGRLIALPETILASFARDKGLETTVSFTGGRTVKGIVLGVEAGKVRFQQVSETGGVAEWSFLVAQLTPAEMHKRLGAETGTDADLMRGFLACKAGNMSLAEADFARAGPGLGATLATSLSKKTAGLPEPAAEPSPKPAEVAKASAVPVPSQPPKATAKPAELTVADPTPGPTPLKEATEENTKAALATLQATQHLETPPTYKITSDGIVLDLSKNPSLKDLSALRGLPIAELHFAGFQQEGALNLKDLHPLVGMPLRKLRIYNAPVSDLAPLAKIPTLTDLNLMSCKFVKDLTPLHGHSGLTSLYVEHCHEVRDLSPLAGLKLASLNIQATAVQDISALRGMPLKQLNITQTAIKDLSPLAETRLERLVIGQNPKLDLNTLAGTKITQLMFNGIVSSLKPLKAVAVDELDINCDWRQIQGVASLPELLPRLRGIRLRSMGLPPSACPEFIFRFPSLKWIVWDDDIPGQSKRQFSVEEFKTKWINKEAK